MARILIADGKIWDGSKYFEGDVYMDGGKILQIGPQLHMEADFVYHAEGRLVTPGLVDAHTHIRGISCEEFGVSGETACIPHGVTAVAEASGGQGNAALMESFLIHSCIFSPSAIEGNHANLEKTAECLSWYGDKAVGIKVSLDPSWAPVENADPLREICAFARERGIKVMVHSTNSPVPMAEILDILAPGDFITHPYHGGRHSALADNFESLKVAKARGIVVDSGFAGHVHTDFAILKKAVEAGALPTNISTDVTRYSSNIRGGKYGMTMAMNIAKAAGMEEADILRAVTSSPAEALGYGDTWGRLEVGRCADLAVFETGYAPFDLTDAAGNRTQGETGYRCVLTICRGETAHREV